MGGPGVVDGQPGVTSGMAHSFPLPPPSFETWLTCWECHLPGKPSARPEPGLALSSDTPHSVSSPPWVSIVFLLPLVDRAGSSPFLTLSPPGGPGA